MTEQKKNNFKRNFYILLVLSALACISLSWYAYNQYQTVEYKAKQIVSLTDTVKFYKTKDGKNAASKNIFVGTKKEVLQVLKNKDPETAELIKSTKGIKSVTNLSVVTINDTTVKVDTIWLPVDSSKLHLSKTITDPYYTAKIVIDGDSLKHSVITKNKFDFITQDKSNGLFRDKSYITSVINRNPNTITEGLDSYEIKPNTHTKEKIGIGVIIGAIIGVLLFK